MVLDMNETEIVTCKVDQKADRDWHLDHNI